MEQLKKSRGRKLYGAVAVFLAVNLAAVIIIGVREAAVINRRMQQRGTRLHSLNRLWRITGILSGCLWR
jgi:hypothetical protein